MQKLRNALYSTHGSRATRVLKRGGTPISWAPIIAIADQNRDHQIASAHRLTTKGHVTPDSHDKMRVQLAVDVFDPSTRLAIQHLLPQAKKPEGTEGTLEFLEAGWRLWCAMYAGSQGDMKKDKLTPANLPAYRDKLEQAVKWFADWAKSCDQV